MLLQKCEKKGEAFLKERRSNNGLSAWYEIHKWYIATSGVGLTERMRELMNPKQAKNKESVLGEIEKWENALTDLTGLGASELGADYKLNAIREIATLFIRDKMDFADTNLDAGNHEGKFKIQYEVLKQWAYMRVKNDRKHDTNKEMPADVNAFGKGRWPEQPTQQ